MTDAYKKRKEGIYKYYEEQINIAEDELKEQQRIWTKKLNLLTKELNDMKEEFKGFCKEQEILNKTNQE